MVRAMPQQSWFSPVMKLLLLRLLPTVFIDKIISPATHPSIQQDRIMEISLVDEQMLYGASLHAHSLQTLRSSATTFSTSFPMPSSLASHWTYRLSAEMAACTSVTFCRMRLTESSILLILLIQNLDLKEEEGSTTSIIYPKEITQLYLRCRKRCPRRERSQVLPQRQACFRERRHLQRKSERASSSAALRLRKRAERDPEIASISCSRQHLLRGVDNLSTSCPTTTGPRYPPKRTKPSLHTKRPQMLASSTPSQAAATSLNFLLSSSESLSSQSGRYFMTLAPASSARINCELYIPTLEDRWACAISLSRGSGNVCSESLSESNNNPSLYSQSRLQQSSGIFQKISNILMQVALSFWLMMPTHSFSSALSKCAEIKLSRKK